MREQEQSRAYLLMVANQTLGSHAGAAVDPG
jgi:hypothetical protein